MNDSAVTLPIHARRPANDEPDGIPTKAPWDRPREEDPGLARYFRTSKLKFRLWVGGLLAILLVLLLWNRTFIPIRSGEAGVLWSRFGGGTVLDRRFGEGTRVIWPWDEMAVYDLRLQERHDTVQVLTSDGLQVAMRVAVRFRPRAGELTMLHQSAGPRYAQTLVWPDVVAAVRHVVRSFRPEDLTVVGESALSRRVEAAARQAVAGHWVDIDRVLVTRITLPARVQAQIQERLADEQKALAAPFILRQAELRRQSWLVEAEAARAFAARTGTSLVKWRSVEALEKLAQSPNAKLVVVGGGKDVPFVLDPGSGEAERVHK